MKPGAEADAEVVMRAAVDSVDAVSSKIREDGRKKENRAKGGG